MLHLLPDDVLYLIVHFLLTSCPPLLGLQRTFGVVGTRIVIRDDKFYRRGNTPPTPVVKRALMALWHRGGVSPDGLVHFRIVTLGTTHAVLYSCTLRGFARGAPPPTLLAHLQVADFSP